MLPPYLFPLFLFAFVSSQNDDAVCRSGNSPFIAVDTKPDGISYSEAGGSGEAKRCLQFCNLEATLHQNFTPVDCPPLCTNAKFKYFLLEDCREGGVRCCYQKIDKPPAGTELIWPWFGVFKDCEKGYFNNGSLHFCEPCKLPTCAGIPDMGSYCNATTGVVSDYNQSMCSPKTKIGNEEIVGIAVAIAILVIVFLFIFLRKKIRAVCRSRTKESASSLVDHEANETSIVTAETETPLILTQPSQSTDIMSPQEEVVEPSDTRTGEAGTGDNPLHPQTADFNSIDDYRLAENVRPEEYAASQAKLNIINNNTCNNVHNSTNNNQMQCAPV